MEKMHPKVSIVIPVYNGAKYVCEAIESALAQTYDNIEILVVNDGSSDNTEEVVKKYQNRIRYFSQPNQGVSAALNLGIEKMQGQYFDWLSHDDLYYPEKVTKEVEALNRCGNPDSVVISNFDLVDENRVLIRNRCRSQKSTNMRYSLLIESPIWGCGALIPKSAFDCCGLFDLEHRYVSDVEMFFRIAEKFPFVTIEESLGASRHHRSQMTFAKMHIHQAQCDWFLKYGLQKITNNDLQEAGNGDMDCALWRVAISSKKNGYSEAGQEAWNRMGNHTLGQYLKFYYVCPIYMLYKKLIHFKRQIQIRF